MEELLDKLDKLKEEINQLELTKELKKLNKKIEKDKELKEDLERYQIEKTDHLKEKIMRNETFQEYKDKETDLNLLIMEMNHRMKKRLKNGECNL